MRGAQPLALPESKMDLMTLKPALVFGLICPAGADLSNTKQQLKAQLAVVGYKYKEIKVSSAISAALQLEKSSDEYQRMIDLMGGGDIIRSKSDGSGVASLIITAIRAERENPEESSIAYVIDSLKNPKELQVLDQIYGRNFYSVSIYSPREERKKFLANKIARSKKQHISREHFYQADKLIELDQAGEDETGQSVRDTFPKADFFVDQGRESDEIKRFIRLVFQDPFITPTVDEYLMFVAKATALRSCDLSRQVGAVISEKSGSIVATGCNEVPYPGGGFFYEGRSSGIGDNRDKEEQRDPNFNEVKRSISEFVDILSRTGYITSSESIDAIAENLLHGDHKKDMEGARFRNLIEFSRVVHAEMHAITEAARVGRSLSGATLYCTTYPCHLCARHIISSGIDEVVYIEPYPKSLTADLYHREIITESPVESVGERVTFRSFRGISPTLYQRVFSHRRRKDSYGAIAKWVPESAMPVGAVFHAVRSEFEAFVANQIAEILNLIHTAPAGDNAPTPKG